MNREHHCGFTYLIRTVVQMNLDLVNQPHHCSIILICTPTLVLIAPVTTLLRHPDLGVCDFCLLISCFTMIIQMCLFSISHMLVHQVM